MNIFKKWFLEGVEEGQRARLHRELQKSINMQDSTMMLHIAKILARVEQGSSIFAFRKYRGNVLAGLVVLDGDLARAANMFDSGILNPVACPDSWKMIPDSKLSLLKQFTDPPDAALAFLAVTPSGQCAFALSNFSSADGEVQWISDIEAIFVAADALFSVGLLHDGPEALTSQHKEQSRSRRIATSLLKPR